MTVERLRLIVAALLVGPAAGSAQAVIDIGDTPACACAIEARLTLTIQDDDGRAGLGAPQTMARLSDGRFLIVPASDPDRILVFDANGRFERMIGGPDEVPRPFVSIVDLEVMPGDSLLVLDSRSGRMTLLGPDLAMLRSPRVPIRASQVEAMADGSMVFLALLPENAQLALPQLHLLNPSLVPTRSFMPAGVSRPDDGAARASRRMAATRDGTIAASYPHDYVVEIWSAEGVHERTLRRRPDWFSQSSDSSDWSEPPQPLAGDPYLDDDGRLWTITLVADEEWDAGLRVIDLPDGWALAPTLGSANQYQDSYFELFDLRTNTLVASTRLDPVLRFRLGESFAASYREDDGGRPFIDVWELTVSGP